MTTLKILKKTLAELAAPAPSGERHFQMGRLINPMFRPQESFGKRHAATGGGAQPGLVGSYLVSMGTAYSSNKARTLSETHVKHNLLARLSLLSASQLWATQFVADKAKGIR